MIALLSMLCPEECGAFIPAKAPAEYTPVDSLRHNPQLPVTWSYMVYDFGTIAEADGPREGEFSFVNSGEKPISIRNVKSSCGCTAVNHILTEVRPGELGWIRFTYDPARRPGKFEKHLKVYFSSGGETVKEPEELTLCGTVIASPQTLGLEYPVAAGPLQCGTKIVSLGAITHGSARRGFIQVYNTSADTVRPRLSTSHKALEAAMLPAALPPGEGGVVSLYLNTADDSETGNLRYSLYLTPDEGVPAEEFYVQALVEEPGAMQSQAYGQFKHRVGDKDLKADDASRDGKDKKKKRQWFPKTYTEVKKAKDKEDKPKRKWFSKTYTEVKKAKDKEDKPKRKLFPKTYTEVKGKTAE